MPAYHSTMIMPVVPAIHLIIGIARDAKHPSEQKPETSASTRAHPHPQDTGHFDLPSLGRYSQARFDLTPIPVIMKMCGEPRERHLMTRLTTICSVEGTHRPWLRFP